MIDRFKNSIYASLKGNGRFFCGFFLDFIVVIGVGVGVGRRRRRKACTFRIFFVVFVGNVVVFLIHIVVFHILVTRFQFQHFFQLKRGNCGKNGCHCLSICFSCFFLGHTFCFWKKSDV